MSYIEKEKLIKADIDSIENRVRHAFNQGYDLGYKEGKANCSKNSTCSTTKNNLGVDCISRAEVKKIAKEMYLEVANMELDVNTISDCISYTSSKCREVLERKLQALSSVTPQEPRWIPVSERLPEELWGVLVYCPTNDNIFCAYLEKGVWKIFSPEALEAIKEIVTAWMPLPKAYREVEE